MHFYCPTCLTPVQDYLSDASRSRRAAFQRVVSNLLTILLLAFIIGASVMLARSINWKEIIDNFKGPAPPAPVEKRGRKSSQVVPAIRPGAPGKPLKLNKERRQVREKRQVG
jgi:hypothetical protein